MLKIIYITLYVEKNIFRFFMLGKLKIIFRTCSCCYTMRMVLIFLGLSIAIFSQAKIDEGLNFAAMGYTATLKIIQSQETEIKTKLREFERYYNLAHTQRQRQRARELFAVTYLETSTLYASNLIKYIELVIVNNAKIKLIPLMPLLSGIDRRVSYLKDQVELIQRFGIVLSQKTHERGKILFIATVLINKMSRVIAELAEHLYKIKIRYKIIQCIFSYIIEPTRLNGLFEDTAVGFFDFMNILDVFQIMVEDNTTDEL